MQLPLLADAGGVEAALEAAGVGRLHFFVLSCVSLIWAGDAMEVMVLSYLGPAAACQFGFSATQQSLLSSAVFSGMVLGAPAWGLAADGLGRRPTLLASAAVVVAAGLASAAAPNYMLLLLSRACVGFGLAAAPVAFTLLMELLPARARGRWGVLVELAWTAGTVAEALIAWGLLNRAGWRPLLLASVLPLALLLVLGQALPESPRYLLAARADAAAAQAVLERIAASNGRQLLFTAHSGDTAHQQQQHQQQQQQVPAGNSCRNSSSSSDADDFEQALLLWDQQESGSATAGAAKPTGSNTPVTSAGSVSSSSARQQQQHQAAHPALLQPSPPPGPNSTPPVQQLLQAQMQQLLEEARLATATLLRPPYAATTSLLLFSWTATSFVYYGLVQLLGQLNIAAAGAAAGPSCQSGVLQVTSQEYFNVLVTSAAEVPAVVFAAACVSVPWLGRRRSVAASLALTAACLVPCIAAAAANGHGAADDGWLSSAAAAGMFGARLFIMSSFTLLWVFTAELLPTHVRASGLGISNACARIGGLLSPFAAINLVALGAPTAAEGLFAAVALAACAAVLLIDSKHDAGQPMEEG